MPKLKPPPAPSGVVWSVSAADESRLAHLVEECGEVMQAVGKAGRFGLDKRHPAGGETNRQWILRELVDLECAIEAVRAALREGL